MTQKPNHKKPKRVGYKKLRIKTVKIPEEEYYRAEDRWYRFWDDQRDGDGNDHDFYDFMGFLKLLDRYWADSYHIAVTPTAARKIALLNSPHYHALLMAYKSTNLL